MLKEGSQRFLQIVCLSTVERDHGSRLCFSVCMTRCIFLTRNGHSTSLGLDFVPFATVLCSKTHRMWNRMLFNQTKQERMQIFKGILFFKSTNNTKTNNLVAASWVYPKGCVQLNDLFIFVLFVAFKRRISVKICTLLWFVLLKSILFNLLCDFDLFFQSISSQLCYIFFFFTLLCVIITSGLYIT